MGGNTTTLPQRNTPAAAMHCAGCHSMLQPAAG